MKFTYAGTRVRDLARASSWGKKALSKKGLALDASR